MDILSKQTEILESLCQNLHNDADTNYEYASYTFTYLPDFDTLESYFEFQRDGEKFNTATKNASENYFLAKELRQLMKAHTGGEWTSFTLTLDANGKAHTKFHYPDDPV